MEYYVKALKQYTDFNGKATRKEYWMFFLFNIIFAFVASMLDNFLGLSSIETGGIGPIYGLYILGTLLPGLAAAVRRLHDIGKSGWWLLIAFVPIIGGIWLIVLLATDSKAEATL